jgi:hypothetical protein
VTRLVLRGNSTSQVAGTLILSVHNYEPRPRENERRTLNDEPVRGYRISPGRQVSRVLYSLLASSR